MLGKLLDTYTITARIGLLSLKTKLYAMRAQWICDLTTNAEKPFWDSNLAARTLYLESLLASDTISRLHGQTLVWLGHTPAASQVLSNRSIDCSVYVTPEDLSRAKKQIEFSEDESECEADNELKPAQSTVISNFDELPFQSRTIDVVIIHHALEQASDPRTVLREASRILAPGGKLVVFGFNPWSLIGFRRGIATVVPDRLSQLRMINPIRLFDWLTLLGLELDAPPAYGGLGLFRNRQRKRSVVPSPSQLPFGGIVITSAVKQNASMNLQWQTPQPRAKLAPVAYPRIDSWQRNGRNRDL